jgi:glycosyltransferase involved in cell wall biosynthesis
MNTVKKVLLCAYACEPNKGSEPGVGWDTSINLAKHDVDSEYYVITRKNNKEGIENKGYPSNLNFIYYELPNFYLFIKRKGNLIRIYYYFWMLGAVIRLWKKRNYFHIIHHITFVNDWLPSLFILLKTKKNYFVWGSIGSNSSIHSKFIFSSKGKRVKAFTYLLQFFFRTFDFLFWKCKSKSDIIIGINDNVKVKLKLKESQLKKFRTLPAIAIDDSQIKSIDYTKEEVNKGFNIISVGKLIQIKNFRLIITSFGRFLNYLSINEKEKVQLIIIGEGALKRELVLLAEKLNISDNVIFKGHISQVEVMKQFQDSDVFLFPTMESAGFVILEAMSNCLPVVALDYGGPKQFILDNQKNQLVSTQGSIEEITNEISNKLINLYNNPELAKEIGRSNNQRVKSNFTWKHKTVSILKIYNELLKNK